MEIFQFTQNMNMILVFPVGHVLAVSASKEVWHLFTSNFHCDIFSCLMLAKSNSFLRNKIINNKNIISTE